jgi:hypothetical protein
LISDVRAAIDHAPTSRVIRGTISEVVGGKLVTLAGPTLIKLAPLTSLMSEGQAWRDILSDLSKLPELDNLVQEWWKSDGTPAGLGDPGVRGGQGKGLVDPNPLAGVVDGALAIVASGPNVGADETWTDYVGGTMKTGALIGTVGGGLIGAVEGAWSGATAGAWFGPWGAVYLGVLGAGAGFFEGAKTGAAGGAAVGAAYGAATYSGHSGSSPSSSDTKPAAPDDQPDAGVGSCSCSDKKDKGGGSNAGDNNGNGDSPPDDGENEAAPCTGCKQPNQSVLPPKPPDHSEETKKGMPKDDDMGSGGNDAGPSPGDGGPVIPLPRLRSVAVGLGSSLFPGEPTTGGSSPEPGGRFGGVYDPSPEGDMGAGGPGPSQAGTGVVKLPPGFAGPNPLTSMPAEEGAPGGTTRGAAGGPGTVTTNGGHQPFVFDPGEEGPIHLGTAFPGASEFAGMLTYVTPRPTSPIITNPAGGNTTFAPVS